MDDDDGGHMDLISRLDAPSVNIKQEENLSLYNPNSAQSPTFAIHNNGHHVPSKYGVHGDNFVAPTPREYNAGYMDTPKGYKYQV